jgi:pimeloyl-ACP methyl ester carboxylesterase
MTSEDGVIKPASRYIKINGMDMHFEESGEGTPLILLHGGTSSCNTWETYLPIFSPHFRVTTPDSRAHGRTNNPAGELSYRQMADDMAEFIKELNLDRPIVCGYSDGGQVALELGMHYPGLCRALVVGAAWYRFSELYLDTMKMAGFDGPGQVDYTHIEENSFDWVEEMKQEHVSSQNPEYWKELVKQISTLWWTPLDYQYEDFQKISEPTLVMLGDRDGIVELQQAVDEYESIPNSELFIIPNADHFTTKSEMSMRVVLDFAMRHSGIT